MLPRFKKILGIALASYCILLSSSAIAINIADVATGGVTTAQMETVLSGSGVTISNLTITPIAGCNVNQGVGLFTNGTSAVGPGPVLGEPTGVIVANNAFTNAANALNTSNNVAGVSNLLCSGTASDADMVAIEAGTVAGEYAAIEFDVVPQSTTLAIPFQFGSDEFPEYVCSNFGDLVGIFVSGPGIVGPFSGGLNAENFAKTIGGDLSSINWVNTGVVGQNGNIGSCGSLANAAFYTDNSNGNLTGGNATVATTNANLELDGFTNTLFQPITVVAGQTYHVKIAVADSADRFFDSTAFIHPLFSTDAFSGFDYGDAPNSYGTLTSSGGPNHGIDNAIFIGTGAPDNEITGTPSVNADGDDLNNADDEDGISSFPILATNATSYSVNVNVTNNSGSSARLVGWIDFNNNGTFESGEGTQTNVANGSSGATVSLNWSSLSGLVSGDTYARIRFSSDLGLSIFTTGSSMSDGEVEDYPISIQSVTFDKYVSTNATCTDTLDTLTVTPGTNVFYCYTVSNPNASAFVISPGNTSDDQGHDISGLEQNYPSLSSQTVIIGPIVAGGAELPTGVTTINNAQVIATISGMNVPDNESASLTVNINPPASGIKQLYFDVVNTGTPNLTRVPPAANTTTGNITGGSTFTLNQAIVFQAPFSITGGSVANVQLRVRRRNGGGARTMQAQLFNGNTGILIGTAATSWNVGNWQTIQVPINIAATENFSTADFIRIVLTNTSVNNRNIQLRTLQGAVRSEVQIQSNTVINIDTINVFSAVYPATTQFTSYEPGSTVFIRATVSDPFGNADITSANITLTDSASNVQENNQAMISVDTPTGATRVYEYQYTIPANPDGIWDISITANEGSEGTISHTSQSTMIIGTTNITISKNSTVLSDPVNVSDPKAIPGAIVEYTIGITNSGFGYVDNDSFVLTDPIASGTTFYFGSPLNPANLIDGVTSSGLNTPLNFIDLSSVVDDIDFSNDGGLSFITPTTDVDGFDTTVPPVNFIRINPKGEFNGSDGTNNPSMQINFRVRVD
ncbi:MAG: choice-of-anchor L domain-containing protein [Gammaproteobacteria bacterium]|nr:choice-of-anchor L domain-containing protein [Gammaproteobacteria bacterium]